MPALPPATNFTAAANQAAVQTAYAGVISYLSTLFGTAGDAQTALQTLGALANQFVPKSAAYTVTTADRGKLINALSGTWTLSLPTVASAGAGFALLVRNGGAGVITIDPAGTETINNSLTEGLQSQASMLLICSGSQWLGLEMPGPAQQSATDTTTGALLRIGTNGGAFGLGNLGALPVLANLDATSSPTGIYAFQGSGVTTGTRPADIPGAAFGIVLVYVDTAAGTIHQLLWRNTPLGTTNGIYKRAYNSSAWGAWDTAFMRSNILGTVAQTAGLPTGSIIERGSNANGEYVRFADGTQICTIGNLSAANASTALGSSFRSADVAWTFPAAFVSTTHLVLDADCDDPDCWGSSNTLSTTGCNIRAIAAVTKASALTLRAKAIGRWF